MIAFLSGTIKHISDTIILDVNGVGYDVRVGATTKAKLTPGKDCQLWIFTVVKEDALDLYGFLTLEEKRLFTTFLSVSGVGPKTACVIVDYGVSEVIAAVQEANVSFFTSVPRVGKKLSQKIIIELKTKLGSGKDLDLSPDSHQFSDIRQALENLGYSTTEIQRVRQAIDVENQTIEQALKHAIQFLSK